MLRISARSAVVSDWRPKMLTRTSSLSMTCLCFNTITKAKVLGYFCKYSLINGVKALTAVA